MLGETVKVWRKEQASTDCMGEPVYTWTAEDVDDCIVRPLAGDNLTDATRPDGVVVSYSVAFPKTYKRRNSLRGCKVTFRDLTEKQALHVAGAPDITKPCPTAWDTIVEVGRVDG